MRIKAIGPLHYEATDGNSVVRIIARDGEEVDVEASIAKMLVETRQATAVRAKRETATK
jgi:hypothetical protein